MMYVSMRVVRQKWKGNGWLLMVTDIPLSIHDKHFLRQNGWPIPGNPAKCNLSYCQEHPGFQKYAVVSNTNSAKASA
jgi:hypothetical protein